MERKISFKLSACLLVVVLGCACMRVSGCDFSGVLVAASKESGEWSLFCIGVFGLSWTQDRERVSDGSNEGNDTLY
jgi:hypothetical protein